MNDQSNSESIVQEWLDVLKDDPAPDPRVVARSRAQFLVQAVSEEEIRRRSVWKSIFRKERFAMNILISVLVIVGLFAGGGMTVRASQNDLPNEPLYGVKTWSENVDLQFQNNPDAKVERLMELAQARVQEISQMVEAGQTPPDRSRLRLEQHLQQAFQLCSNMDDAALDRTLLQLRNQLQQQEREMQNLQNHAAQNAQQPILERTRAMLQTHLQLANDGLQNHEMFRNTVRNGFHYGLTQTPPTSVPSTPVTPNGQQNGQATPQAGPGEGNGLGPNGQQNGQATAQAGPGPNGQQNGQSTPQVGPNSSVTPMQNQNQNQNGSGSGGSDSGGGGGDGSGGGSGSGGNDGGGGSGSGSGSGGSDGGGNESGGGGGNRP